MKVYFGFLSLLFSCLLSSSQDLPSDINGFGRSGSIIQLSELKDTLILVSFENYASFLCAGEQTPLYDIYYDYYDKNFGIFAVYLIPQMYSERKDIIDYINKLNPWPKKIIDNWDDKDCISWGVSEPTKFLIHKNGHIEQVSLAYLYFYLKKIFKE